MRDPRDVWQEAFDKAEWNGDDSFLCSKKADDAVAEYLADLTDKALEALKERN